MVSLVPGQQRELDKLKMMRLALQREVCETIDEFGPEMYEDFDEVSLPVSRLTAI